MHWFKQHLNWTLIFGVLALLAIMYPLLSFLSHTAPSWSFWLTFAIGILAYYTLYDYVLLKKGRRGNGPKDGMGFGWFLLWLTGGLGIIVLLLVKAKPIEKSDKEIKRA